MKFTLSGTVLALSLVGSAVAVDSWKRDPEGFTHIARDGVQRSYAANGTVLDARGLPPDLVARYTGIHEYIDGREVTDRSQLFNPPEHLKPREFTDSSANAAWKKRSLQAREFTPRGLGTALTKRATYDCNNIGCNNNYDCGTDVDMCADCLLTGVETSKKKAGYAGYCLQPSIETKKTGWEEKFSTWFKEKLNIKYGNMPVFTHVH